jgi:hypothetical protein
MSAEERTIAVARHYAEVVAACRKRVAELARIAPRQGPGATVTTPPSPSAWRSRRFPLVVGLARFAPRLPEAKHAAPGRICNALSALGRLLT